MRRNHGDAAAHHSTQNTQHHVKDRHTNTATDHKKQNTHQRSMEEGGDGVVRARVEDGSLAGSRGHGFRAGGTAQPETWRPERTDEGSAVPNRRAGGQHLTILTLQYAHTKNSQSHMHLQKLTQALKY